MSSVVFFILFPVTVGVSVHILSVSSTISHWFPNWTFIIYSVHRYICLPTPPYFLSSSVRCCGAGTNQRGCALPSPQEPVEYQNTTYGDNVWSTCHDHHWSYRCSWRPVPWVFCCWPSLGQQQQPYGSVDPDVPGRVSLNWTENAADQLSQFRSAKTQARFVTVGPKFRVELFVFRWTNCLTNFEFGHDHQD